MPDVEVLHKARELVDQLDFPAAQQLLREALSQAPTQPGEAGSDTADLAAFYAGVLLQLGEPHAARGWAAYAYTAAQRLHGEPDRRSTHALGVLACALHRAGALSRAAHHYHQLVEVLSALEGRDGDRTLAARADAAVVDHARGACSAAKFELDEVIAAHAALHGPSHPIGIRMMARLAAMWRDCGEFGRAHELLDRARSASAALDPGDDVHRLLAAAARAEADQTHQCGVVAVRRQSAATGVHDVPAGPADEWPQDEGFGPPGPAAATADPPGSAMAVAPATASSVGIAPAALALTSMSADLDVLRPPRAPHSSSDKPRGRRPTAVAAMVATGAVIAASAAVTAVAVLADQRQAASPATSSSPSSPAESGPASPHRTQPPAPAGPVSDLDLVDEGHQLLISWRYPTGAAAPVIISASRAGEPMRPLQSLPAGTDDFVLPGLDPRQDYCVAVTVAYRADQTVMSPPVCTERASSAKR